jgi:hypothetical protein
MFVWLMPIFVQPARVHIGLPRSVFFLLVFFVEVSENLNATLLKPSFNASCFAQDRSSYSSVETNIARNV